MSASPSFDDDDGFRSAEDVLPRAPIDAAPPVQVAPKPKAAPKNGTPAPREQIPEGYEQTTVKKTVRPAPARPAPAEPVVPVVEQNPFDLLADVEGGQIEVTRVGPATGPGWKGKKFRGEMPHYCRMGKIQKTASMLDDAQKRWGGGEYVFSGFGADGKARSVKTVLPGAPLPPDNIDEDEEEGYREDEEGSLRIGEIEERLRAERDPFEPDARGFVRPREDVAAAGGESGWAYMHAVNAWKWLGPGAPPGPPPPLPGQAATGFQHAFNPRAFDHSRDGEQEKEIASLKDSVRQILDRLSQPQVNPVDTMLRMQQDQREQAKLDWDREKEERRIQQDREREERKAELEREREERRAAAEREREDRREQREREREAIKAQQEAMDRNWKMMVDAGKNSDPFALIEKLSKAGLMGGNQASDQVEQTRLITEAVGDAVDKIPDALRAFREGGQQAPAGPPPPQGVNPQAFAAAQAQMDNFRLLGSVIASYQEGVHPDDMPYTIKVACSTLGLNHRKIFAMVSLATPDIIAAELEKQIAGKQVAPETRAQVDHAKGLVTSPDGRAWWAAVQGAVRRAQAAAQAQTQPQVPQQPAPQVSAAPAAPPHPLAPQPAPNGQATGHPFATPGV